VCGAERRIGGAVVWTMGSQYIDGRIETSVHIEALPDEELTSAQARQHAAAVLDCADEADAWVGCAPRFRGYRHPGGLPPPQPTGETAMSTPQRRAWVPNVNMVADQLIQDYRSYIEQFGPDDGAAHGNVETLKTMEHWQGIARANGDDFRELDWLALVSELTRRAAEQS
jgi:hypothetical protein